MDTKLSLANANWMKDLDPRLKDVSICYLAIPGSHDSLSYSITRQNGLSPDAPNIAKIFGRFLGSFMGRITFNWCVTQSLDIKQQFLFGIRYFDIRTARKGSKLLACHGLYGMEVIDALEEINECLNEHPEEVVILDFQHIYDFTSMDHRFLMGKIHSIFQFKLCPEPKNVTDVTLNWLKNNRYQVIVIYRTDEIDLTSYLWHSSKWITLWPNTTNLNYLYNYLTETLRDRPENTGFVSQCLFTPSTAFITFHILSTLKKKCCIECDLKIKSLWIKKQKSLRPDGVNVVIADFVNLPHFDFCSTVININNCSL
ncbi:PI-PLC X domain-containing protein 2 [Planococcus citri]|uniref:PI-PLC X domain-containing protein 2 n=1 Tax=Planococcus citri TaxID=170843 RepID=UPI0031F97FD8